MESLANWATRRSLLPFCVVPLLARNVDVAAGDGDRAGRSIMRCVSGQYGGDVIEPVDGLSVGVTLGVSLIACDVYIAAGNSDCVGRGALLSISENDGRTVLPVFGNVVAGRGVESKTS